MSMELDFEIDKITESIEDAQTGEVYKTLVLPVTQADLKEVTKQNGWLFDWKFEYLQPEHKVYKLVTENEPKTALIPHYEKTLGAVHLGGNKMAIFEENAQILIDNYFKGD